MRLFLLNRNKTLLRRLLSLTFALVLLYAVLPAAVYAEDAHETVRVGYYENEVFQEGAMEGAVKTGYAYEYYQKLSEYTGWRYAYVYGSFSELYQMLLDGEIDMLAGLAWREDRAALIGYPDAAMGNESYYLLKHKDDTEFTADPATLNGSRIGVLDSAMLAVLTQYLDDHGVTAEVVAYPEYAQLFDAFDSKAVDILAAESDGAYGRSHAEVLSVFGASDYYLCVSKARPDLLAELNSAQALLMAEEPTWLNTLSAKYYSISVTALAFSQAEREWMDSHTSLRVGYFDNYLPFSDTDPQGNVNGAVTDIVSAILEAVGESDIAVTYIGYTSYDSMIAGINSGEIDVAFPVGGGLYYSEENGIYQSNTVSAAPAELVYRGEFTEETTRHFAINENNRMQYYFVRNNYPDAEITFYQSIDECLGAVASGKAGCATMNGLRANDILRNREYNALSHRQTSYIDPRCFGVEIGNEGLLRLLNRGINILGVEYTQNLLHRYNDDLFSYGFADMLQDHIALFGTVILAVAAIIIFLLIRDSRRNRQEIRENEASRLTLEEKNRELAESQQALSDALLAAEQANKAKTAFLSNMSHEIRTPMNAIIGLDSIALKDPQTPAQTREYLEQIGTSAEHLLNLINDILDMSRIESGRLVLRNEEFSFAKLLEALNTMFSAQCRSKGLEYRCSINGEVDDYYIGDSMKLRQALINILGNAVKFTPAGGRVELDVKRKAQFDGKTTLEFKVSDTGIGISKEFLPQLFDTFTQEDASTTSKYGSSGLGMAITKNIVELMNGNIGVESVKGEGTTFTVTVTLSDASHISAKDEMQEIHPSEMTVLVVDDDPTSCEHASLVLEKSGIASEVATSGAKALEMVKLRHVRREPYNLILLDWQMPEMDGVETARRIRAVTGDSTAIIILTAYNWDDILDEAQQAGIDSFIAKPLFAAAVIEEFSTALQRKKLSAGEQMKKAELSGRRILLAEDMEVNAKIMMMVLKARKMEVDHAENGKIAVEKMAASPEGHYSAILMDIRMPEMDGLEATRLIRAIDRPDAKAIPIIALTANAFDEDVQRSLQAGMNAHLSKPVKPDALYETLENLIRE